MKERSRKFFACNVQLRKLYESITPLKGMGSAEEIARVILFLLGSDASFITGQTIVVDGCLSLQWQKSVALKIASLESWKPSEMNR